MKKILTAALLVGVLLVLSFTVQAAGEGACPRLTDEADLLTQDEETELLDLLDGISERRQFDVIIVTVNSLNGEEPYAYADDFYDYNGFGIGSERDGILLLVSMEYRDWQLSASGLGMYVLSNGREESITDDFLPYLSAGDYAEAFRTFARDCEEYVPIAMEERENYSIEELTEENKRPNFVILALASLCAGTLIAFIFVMVMKSQLKSVKPQVMAADYVRPNSFRLTGQSDIFLYSTVARVPKPKNNGGSSGGGGSSRVGSSGGMHSGGGGKF